MTSLLVLNVVISDILQIQNAFCKPDVALGLLLLNAFFLVNLLWFLVNLLGADSEKDKERRNSGLLPLVPGELSWRQRVLGSLWDWDGRRKEGEAAGPLNPASVGALRNG